MPWLVSRNIPLESDKSLQRWIAELAEQIDDAGIDRFTLIRNTLSHVMYGVPYAELLERSPISAFGLDAHNITFEAEYYSVTDHAKFQKVKPLLWLWKCLDQTPLGQSIHSGVFIRRMLAERIFKRVGKNLKIFQNVEVSVGYNIEAGDDVVLHRHVFVDDIGGVILHDGASLSDYVNVYSNTHDVHDVPDVTLKQTVIGKGVRVTYHATILAGTVISDDAMVGAMALANRDVAPHNIVLGIPAKPKLLKSRQGEEGFAHPVVDAGVYVKQEETRVNTDFNHTAARPVEPIESAKESQ